MNWFHRRRKNRRNWAYLHEHRKTNHTSLVTYINGLKRHGFYKVGEGAFSTVWFHPKSDRAVKVSHNPDMWSQYIQWGAKSGWMGKFVPRVFSYKYHVRGNFSVAVMEKLADCVSNINARHPQFATLSLVNLVTQAPANDNLIKVVSVFSPELPRFLKEFMSAFKHRYDLHGQNAMVRSDGSFVLTDPVYGGRPVTERLRFAA